MKIDCFEVRSCPYCGSDRLILSNERASIWVTCRECLTMGPTCDTIQEAVSKWNSVYPDLDSDFKDNWLESLAEEQDKKVYHASDIREIIMHLLELKTETERLTQRINAILSLGRPRK